MSIEKFEKLLGAHLKQNASEQDVLEALQETLKDNPEKEKDVFSLLQSLFDADLLTASKFSFYINQLKEIKKQPSADEEDQTVFQNNKTVIRTAETDEKGDSAENLTQPTGTHTTGDSINSWSKPFLSEESDELTVGSIIKERFKLLAFIGRGGMGDVFKAEDLRRTDAGDVETEVAIKVLNREFREHPESLRTLQREARKTQNLAHPHIVNVYDFDRDNHNVFMTMEFMDGESLSKLIKRNKKGIQRELAFKLILEICSALEYAHKKGLVHSDLKPNNIFVVDKEIKIFDFGIARAAVDQVGLNDKQDTFDAGSIGALTPSYASPEMLDRKADADPRDDIYALGCIAYEVLSGSHPFVKDGKKVSAEIAQARQMIPPKITGLSKNQQAALVQCLEFDRSKRIDSVQNFTSKFFEDNKRQTNKKPLIVTAALIFIGVFIYFFYQFYSTKDIRNFATQLNNQQKQEVFATIDNTLKLDVVGQRRIFDDFSIKEPLREFLKQEANNYASSGQLAMAINTAELASKIYPDSLEIDALLSTLDESQKDYVLSLYKQLDELLDNSKDLNINHQQVFTILDKLRKTNPEDARLNNPQPLIALQTLAENNLEQNLFSTSKGLLKSAQDIIESNSEFVQFSDKNIALQRKLERLENTQEAKIIIESILVSLGKLDELELNSLLRQRADVEKLLTIADDQVINNVQQRTDEILKEEADRLISEDKWQEALALNNNLQSITTNEAFNSTLIKIERARASEVTRIANTVQQIRNLARSGNPQEAKRILSSIENTLKSGDFDRDKYISLIETVSSAFLLLSRKNLENGNLELAQQSLEEGREVLSNFSEESLAALNQQLLLQEQNLQNAILVKDTETKEQEQKLFAENQRQLISSYIDAIDNILNKDQLDIADLSSFQNSVDGLISLQPEHTKAATSTTKIQNKILEQSSSNDPATISNVIELVDESISIFGDNQALLDRKLELEKQSAIYLEEQRLTDISTYREKAEALIETSSTLKEFEQIQNYIDSLTSLEASSILLKTINTSASQKLIKLADSSQQNQDFTSARSFLKRAEKFGLTKEEFTVFNNDIDKAEKKLKEKQLALKRESEIAASMQRINASLAAKEFEAAENIYKQMQANQLLDASNNNVLKSNFKNSYLDAAVKAYEQLEVNKAESLLGSALQFSNDASVEEKNLLNTLETKFRTMKTILNASTKNVPVAQSLLNSAKNLFPNDPIIQNFNLDQNQKDKLQENNMESLNSVKQGVPCTSKMSGKGEQFTCRDVLSDGSSGPYMVVLPDYDGKSLAISKYEIRIGEYNIYCEVSKSCNRLSGDEMLPVTGISVEQINNFSRWITKATGHTYRLPTVQEWRYAASADGKIPSMSNCDGNTKSLQVVNYEKEQTSNGWGVSNFLGNAQEIATIRRGYAALGGHYQDSGNNCTLEASRIISQNTDDKTGFRLIKEL